MEKRLKYFWFLVEYVTFLLLPPLHYHSQIKSKNSAGTRKGGGTGGHTDWMWASGLCEGRKRGKVPDVSLMVWSKRVKRRRV